MARARENKIPGEVDLNLTPIMNLFMVIIPFLLMGAAFYQIGVIPISTPTHEPGSSDVPKTPTVVAVTLAVKADGLDLSVASVSLTPDELEALAFRSPVKQGSYDLAALQAHLAMLKAKYSASTTIIFVPHDDVGYQTLIEILDVTREREVGVNPDGTPKTEELFPVSVFSRFIPPSAQPAEESLEELPSEGESEGGEGE
ncbi:MAG: biopolymer transporter ExbD [Myxococcota bacterium]|jgi:biopolymer transport protein ExbD|nr:biopolymer transporter ExbD [Myxococcota bacterium]